MAEDLREACDTMQADMAEHQRRFVGEPTASSNQRLAADLFQRIENELADAPPAPPAEPVQPPPVERKTEHREIEDRKYLVSTAPNDDIRTRVATPAERWFIEHAMPRIELLLTKVETGPLGEPSWHTRVMAVMELRSRVPGLRAIGMIAEAEGRRRRYMHELLELLEDSNRLFGDWKADAPKKLIVSG